MITNKIIYVPCSPLIPLWHSSVKGSQVDSEVSFIL